MDSIGESNTIATIHVWWSQQNRVFISANVPPYRVGGMIDDWTRAFE